MNISDQLNTAADLIERDGWHRNGYAPDQTEDGTPIAGLPVCAMGAMYQAAGVRVTWNAELECWGGFGGLDILAAVVIADYLDLISGANMGSIPSWNDHPERTASEVIETLRAAAVIEAAKEVAIVVVEPRVAVG